MKLSACLIVRNEATEIEACLETLRDADEIVIVDTGSIDETRTLVLNWAATNNLRPVCLHTFNWVDDFSAARNWAASLCTGDWILHIDADMRLASGGIAQLRRLAAITQARTIAITQESEKGGWRNRRVLCHRPGVKWAGAIHEAMEIDDGPWAEEVIVRYGYSDSHRHDAERNLRMLRAEAEREPTPRVCYYLGAELFERGKIGEAVGWFEKCVAETAWKAERADAWLYLAKIRWRQCRGDEAREAALRCLANTPDCHEALMLMAEMSFPAEAAVWRRYATLATNEGVIFARSCHPRGSALDAEK